MIQKDTIADIMDKLSKKEGTYLSEAQFQFELAWELQKEIGENGRVLLEYTACSKRQADGKKKRFESDILVLFKDKTYIAIELKYKTCEAVIDGVTLVQQSGQPETKYDYLWDVRRIELLMNKDEQHYEYYMGDCRCVGGYAIFLTNDSSYYNEPKNKKTSSYNFRLHESKTPSGELTWNVETLSNWMKSRTPFTIEGSYDMEWKTFKEYEYKGKKKAFKWLITTIC